jgi:hypothetical protein
MRIADLPTEDRAKLVAGQQVADDIAEGRASDEQLYGRRVLLVNANSKLPPLVRNTPADVTVIALDATVAGQLRRDRMLSRMGIRISCLPCLLVREDAQQVDDGEGGTVTIPARWREIRIGDLPRDQWMWTDDPRGNPRVEYLRRQPIVREPDGDTKPVDPRGGGRP